MKLFLWLAVIATTAHAAADSVAAPSEASDNSKRPPTTEIVRSSGDDFPGADLPRVSRVVSYAYRETPLCADNLRFLLAHGGLEYFPDLAIVLVVNGFDISVELPSDLPFLVLVKRENEGLDFGAHSAGLLELERLLGSAEAMPDEYGFLNCGVTGPFLPAYLPPDFDWFASFTKRLNEKVRLVGTYISCLPPGDAGGRGPRVEGHSFFTDAKGLWVLREARVMRAMEGKYDAIVNGEYGLTRAMFAAGYTIDTPLYRYQGVDWENKANWDCNMNRFVGRGGGYEKGSVNPFETVFFKRVWPTLGDAGARAVRFEETARYMSWRALWASGGGGYHADLPPPSTQPPPFYDPNFAPPGSKKARSLTALVLFIFFITASVAAYLVYFQRNALCSSAEKSASEIV